MAKLAKRFNKGKVQWSQLDFASLEGAIRVLMYGETKYKERSNWKKPFPRHELLDSAQRHLAALMKGEDYDKETGEHHASHLICNAMFLVYHFDKKNKNK